MVAHNDEPGTGPIRPRRLRIDEHGVSRTPRPLDEASAHSGRRVVIAAGLALLVVWALLWLAFRHWRAGYRERTAFGASSVATAIDPMASAPPPGLDPRAWRQAVAETHAMLATLTAANLLDLSQMRALRDDIRARVDRARARPETGPDELAGLWNEVARQAGPILAKRHPRPSLLPPMPAPPRS